MDSAQLTGFAEALDRRFKGEKQRGERTWKFWDNGIECTGRGTREADCLGWRVWIKSWNWAHYV